MVFHVFRQVEQQYDADEGVKQREIIGFEPVSVLLVSHNQAVEDVPDKQNEQQRAGEAEGRPEAPPYAFYRIALEEKKIRQVQHAETDLGKAGPKLAGHQRTVSVRIIELKNREKDVKRREHGKQHEKDGADLSMKRPFTDFCFFAMFCSLLTLFRQTSRRCRRR